MTREVIIKQCNLLPGAALTVPRGGQTVIYHSGDTFGQALEDHERVHAQQIEDMGPVAYWAVHLWARVATAHHAFRAIARRKNPVLQLTVAVEHEIELAGYRAQWPDIPDDQIIAHFRGG